MQCSDIDGRVNWDLKQIYNFPIFNLSIHNLSSVTMEMHFWKSDLTKTSLEVHPKG